MDLVIALGAGLIVGLIYAIMRTRSPAPPPQALVGLAGMLMGYTILESWLG